MQDEKVKASEYFNYHRRASTVVHVGQTPLGGNNPIRLQSMTTTATTDTEASVSQSERIIQSGADYVRLTAQGTREAENLANIRQALHEKGYTTPLVADIHFNPHVADVAAAIVEKVRINPGNYVDAARTFKKLSYTDEEYAAELKKISDRLIPFLHICREHHTAIRIGVNHGSLSDRIMSRYGDTPEGIVESCMEFLRVCRKEHFEEVVLSIKASNTPVMVRSVHLLIDAMNREDMHFPLHLGVTEAGEGEDGRIKSAVGIGALLSDGIGDTIRVSLSEAPEQEIPVARKLRDYILRRDGAPVIQGNIVPQFNYLHPERRITQPVLNIGQGHMPIVITDYDEATKAESELTPDYIYLRDRLSAAKQGGSYIIDSAVWKDQPGLFPAFTRHTLHDMDTCRASLKFLFLSYESLDAEALDSLRRHPEVAVIAQSNHINCVGHLRAFVHSLMGHGLTNPVILFHSYHYNKEEKEDFQLASSADTGALLFDGLCDGLFLSNHTSEGPSLPQNIVCRTAFSILQAAGLRRTRTEYISCPGCGRTLYDLQTTIQRIKTATQGLRNLKIAVMGCIVNGPGEMADADYGYVGAARGKISLYRGKECVEKNIPEDEAVEKLLHLLQKDGYAADTTK